MALKLGELNVVLKTDNSGLRRGLAEARHDVRQAGDDMDRSFVRQAALLAAKFAREFRDFYRHTASGLASALTAGLTTGTQTALSGMSALGTGAVNLTTNLWNLIPAVLAISAAMAAMGPATLLLGGVLGSIPALATGALAAVGALGLGAIGLTEAFQDSARAGGSVVDRVRQIALAERHLADANRAATDAQEGLNRARKAAAERLQDLRRNLAGARLDERAALNAVADARRQLEYANGTGHEERIARAQLAYEQAEQSLADVQDRVEDLAAEQADAAERGVEGSDEVRAALERQRQAVEGISDAQYELGRAQTATSGGAVRQATQIAASAASAIAAIKSLGPAWTTLRLDVQERLLAGVDEEILSLSDAWMPTLRDRLGGMSTMFNGLFKQWAETSRDPEFIANISAGWLSVERLIDRVGGAIAGPGLEAFGRLSAAATPFVDALGQGIGGFIEEFAEWIKNAEKSGALTDFFDDATEFFKDVKAIGGDALSIVGSIMSILLGNSDSARRNGMNDFVDLFDRMAEWFRSDKNQERISKVLSSLFDFGEWTVDKGIPTFLWLMDTLGDVWDKFDAGLQRIKDFKDGVKTNLDQVKLFATAFRDQLAALNPFSGLISSFRSALNWIIDRWNGFRFTIGGGNFGPISIPSATFDTWDIPRLARGAYIPPMNGGRLAVMAEAGEPEWALPDSKLRQALDEAVARGRNGGDGATPEIHVHNYIDGRELKSVVRVELKEQNRDIFRRVQAGVGIR